MHSEGMQMCRFGNIATIKSWENGLATFRRKKKGQLQSSGAVTRLFKFLLSSLLSSSWGYRRTNSHNLRQPPLRVKHAAKPTVKIDLYESKFISADPQSEERLHDEAPHEKCRLVPWRWLSLSGTNKQHQSEKQFFNFLKARPVQQLAAMRSLRSRLVFSPRHIY